MQSQNTLQQNGPSLESNQFHDSNSVGISKPRQPEVLFLTISYFITTVKIWIHIPADL